MRALAGYGWPQGLHEISSQYFPGRLDWHRRETQEDAEEETEVGREEDRLF